jgi:hypothetical protein
MTISAMFWDVEKFWTRNIFSNLSSCTSNAAAEV